MRADLQEHLRGCEHCEVTLSTTRKTIQIYRSHEIYEMPAGLRERLHKAHHGALQKGLLNSSRRQFFKTQFQAPFKLLLLWSRQQQRTLV